MVFHPLSQSPRPSWPSLASGLPKPDLPSVPSAQPLIAYNCLSLPLFSVPPSLAPGLAFRNWVTSRGWHLPPMYPRRSISRATTHTRRGRFTCMSHHVRTVRPYTYAVTALHEAALEILVEFDPLIPLVSQPAVSPSLSSP